MVKTTKFKPKADIDFEQELWDAANELRGAVAKNQYKDYVLSLLFVKHLSERYGLRREEIRNECANPQSDYYTTDTNAQQALLDDELEYQVKNVYKDAREATWPYLHKKAGQGRISDLSFDCGNNLLQKSSTIIAT